MEAMPLLVRTVVGNHTASAIRNALAETAEGKAISTIGIHAVEGIGPSTRTRQKYKNQPRFFGDKRETPRCRCSRSAVRMLRTD